MGRWNRRYFPRRNYNYQYQDFPPIDFDDKFDSAIQENSVPSWEIEFCKSVGIPWNKIIYMKKYISCHDSVVKWDDSASQEAFDDAKTRYWAKTNGVPYDNPLPDPFKYVDEVDWNAMVDPEMILDLDRDFFNPDEANANNSEDVSGCTLSQDNKNLSNGENAWEVGHARRNGTPEAGQGSGEWNESKVSKNVGDPWEESCTRTGGPFKGTGWRDGGNGSSWGWNPGQSAPSGLDNTWNNSWNHDSGNAVCTRQKESGNNKNGSWSQNSWNDRDRPGNSAPSGLDRNNSWNHDSGDVGCTRQQDWGNNKNGSWSRNAWNNNDHNGFQTRNSWTDRDHKPWNSSNHCDPRGNNALRGGGATWENNSRSWKKSGFQTNQPAYFDPEGSNTGRESFYGGSRKREGSSYHTSTFKTSRFQGGEQGGTYTWRKVNSEDYK